MAHLIILCHEERFNQFSEKMQRDGLDPHTCGGDFRLLAHSLRLCVPIPRGYVALLLQASFFFPSFLLVAGRARAGGRHKECKYSSVRADAFEGIRLAEEIERGKVYVVDAFTH